MNEYISLISNGPTCVYELTSFIGVKIIAFNDNKQLRNRQRKIAILSPYRGATVRLISLSAHVLCFLFAVFLSWYASNVSHWFSTCEPLCLHQFCGGLDSYYTNACLRKSNNNNKYGPTPVYSGWFSLRWFVRNWGLLKKTYGTMRKSKNTRKKLFRSLCSVPVT